MMESHSTLVPLLRALVATISQVGEPTACQEFTGRDPHRTPERYDRRMRRVRGLSACAFVAAIVVASAAGCVDNGSACTLLDSCLACTMDGCSWCLETGMCHEVTVVCPGEVALRPEQCEAERRKTSLDAAVATTSALQR